MGNQILVNPFPTGSDVTQSSQTLSGSIALYGSAVSTGEPINWANIVSGLSFNEINFQGNGIAGQNLAYTTGFAVSTGVVTVTANNNFVAGQLVTFQGNTQTLSALFNGQTVQVISATSTTFTAATTNTGTTTTSDVGIAVSGQQFIPLARSRGAAQNLTITAFSASGGVVTVTAANKLLPGAEVIVTSASSGIGATLNGQTVTVISATATAFKITSSATGATGTGTGVGTNPPSPFSVKFWSSLDSGYVYQYNQTFGTLFVLVQGAAATDPLANLGAGSYPSGVLGDVIKYEAKFAKA